MSCCRALGRWVQLRKTISLALALNFNPCSKYDRLAAMAVGICSASLLYSPTFREQQIWSGLFCWMNIVAAMAAGASRYYSDAPLGFGGLPDRFVSLMECASR